MVTPKKIELRVPFNLRGADAEQFETVRRYHEKRLNTRLSAVQTARILVGDSLKKMAVK